MTGVQTCALPICRRSAVGVPPARPRPLRGQLRGARARRLADGRPPDLHALAERFIIGHKFFSVRADFAAVDVNVRGQGRGLRQGRRSRPHRCEICDESTGPNVAEDHDGSWRPRVVERSIPVIWFMQTDRRGRGPGGCCGAENAPGAAPRRSGSEEEPRAWQPHGSHGGTAPRSMSGGRSPAVEDLTCETALDATTTS